MTEGPGMPPRPPAPSVVAARPGLLERLKLSEPVRLYLYGLAAVAVLGLTVAGVVTGEWADYTLYAAGVVLGLVVPAEAVRASVYSPAGHAAAAAGTVQRVLAENPDALTPGGVAYVRPAAPR